jgi:hypothetical protein
MTLSYTPTQPEAGTAVVVTGSVTGTVGFGVIDYQWRVLLGTTPVEHTVRATDGSEIEFLPQTPGTYRIELTGSVGSQACTDKAEDIPVVAPNAVTVTYRLRLIPGDQTAPVQEKIVKVTGGGPDWPLGTLSLEDGLDASGTVTDSSPAALPAYLRAIKVGGDGFPDTETFSDSSGQFPMRLMPGTYNLLVVPQQNLAPATLAMGLSPTQIAGGLVVPAGDPVGGVVLDSGGTPISGASVSMRAGVVPSTIGTSDGSGSFALELRAGVATSVSVSSPSPGLPNLELAAGAWSASAGDTLTIRYAAITGRSLSAAVTQSDGSTPAPGARVTFVARPISNAATITPQGGSALAAEGRVRVSVVADGSGQISAMLPEAVYDVIVAPGSGAPSSEAAQLTSIDLTGSNPTPTTVSLATAATLQGAVADGDQQPVAGIKVTAVPRGLLANLGTTVTGYTGADGSYGLALVGGADYELTFESPTQAHGRYQQQVTAPAAGSSASAPAVSLQPALAVHGTVERLGAGGAGAVTVVLLCYECTGMEAQSPIAVGVTDSTGKFRLAVPDPGVEAAQ